MRKGGRVCVCERECMREREKERERKRERESMREREWSVPYTFIIGAPSASLCEWLLSIVHESFTCNTV